MNRFPVWKYVLIAVVVLAALLYTIPNFFGESPAVQVSTAKTTLQVDGALMSRVEDVLRKANVPYTGVQLDATGVRVRLSDPAIGSPPGLVDAETVARLWAALERAGQARRVREQLLDVTMVRR